MNLSAKTLVAAAIGAAVVSFAGAARATLFIADGDRIGAYTDGGAPIDAGFIHLDGVTGLAIGPDGNLYAATPIGNGGAPGIFRYNPSTGAQIGGPFVDYTGIAQSPSNPQGMHFGADHNLYVADETLAQVYVFGPTGAFIRTLTSPTVSDPGGPIIAQPTGLTADTLHFYVTSGQGVARFNPGPDTFSDFVPTGTLNNPRDAAFGPDGKLYVLDVSSSPRVLRFDAAGVLDPAFDIDLNALYGSQGIVEFPSNLNFGPDGRLDISGFDAFSVNGTGSVLQFDLNGNFTGYLIPSQPQGPGALTQFDSFFVFAPAPGPAVPEPATAALTLLAVTTLGTALLRRRPRHAM
jgi:hypothetical protein